MANRLSRFLATMLGVGLLFLYGPIVSVVVYSFNESRLVTVWAGFSTHWYGELALRNEQIRHRGPPAGASRSRCRRRAWRWC